MAQDEGLALIEALQQLAQGPDPQILALLAQDNIPAGNRQKRSFFETLEGMGEVQFQKHFRFHKEVIYKLIDDVYVNLPPPTYGRRELNNREKGLIGIWYLANSCPYRLLAEQFEITESTAFEVVTQFMTAVVKTFNSTVRLPQAQDPLTTIPGCIGYIDGTHIQFLKRPRDEPDLYYDRHQNWSLNVLAVVGHNLEILYYFIGAFGSAHDKRVYRCSNLPELLSQLPAGLLILGDSAYPTTTRLLSPFVNPTSPEEMNFNQVHKGQRVKVENAFGNLKGQWRRLKNLDVNSIERAKLVVESCMLIHNYGIRAKNEREVAAAQELVVVPHDLVVEVDTSPAGIAKRNEIAAMLL